MAYDPLNAVAEGIYQVKIPLPFALNSVNCYLIHDHEGWCIVDTGIHWPEAVATWQAAFRELKLSPADVSRVILTHVHPDHYGLAGWWQDQAEQAGRAIQVYASPREIQQERQVWHQETDRHFGDWLVRQGMPGAMAQAVHEGLDDTRSMTRPTPSALLPLDSSAPLHIGERHFSVYQYAGHSDGHLLFYDEDDQLMLCGDHVLMKITPNIGIWTHTDPAPLAHFIESLALLRALEVRVALPGHKTLIHDWRGRIDELLHHHEERLKQTLRAVEAGYHTPYEVSEQLFEVARFTPHEWRFALAEGLAHLDYLHGTGQLSRHEDRPWYQLA